MPHALALALAAMPDSIPRTVASPLPAPTLEALVVRARDGEVRAFETLYRRCVGRVFALCLRLCADRPQAELLTQDVFVHAWQRLDRFHGEGAFTTWLHRLTVNFALQRRRTDSRRREREGARAALQVVETLPQGQRDAGLDLEAALASLPERARVVLVLHDLEGYRHEDIAEVMHTSVGTSKAQLHRARRRLRELLA